MKTLLPFFITFLFFVFFHQSQGQQLPFAIDTDFSDTDGNVHNIQDYFDNEKSVFIFYFDNSPSAYQQFQNLNLIDFYNTYGQGGNNDVVVLSMAVYGFDTYASLSNLDFSSTLGTGYENVSYSDNNPIPIIINSFGTDSLELFGLYGLTMYCYDNNYYSFGAGNSELYMNALYNLCCTSLETYDPGILLPYSTEFNCDPSQINYTLTNGAPVPFNSTDIDVFINDNFDTQFTTTQLVEGCSSVDLTYQNANFLEEDSIILAIANSNLNTSNDTVQTSFLNIDTVSGRIRLEVINPTGSFSSAYLTTPFGGFFGSAYAGVQNNWLGELFLEEGCHDLVMDIPGDIVSGLLVITSIDSFGNIEDTLYVNDPDSGYFAGLTLRVFVTEPSEPLLSGYIFEDTNLSQIFNPSLPRIEGVEVNHGPYTTFSDINGYYEIPAGDLNDPISINYNTSVWPVITTPNPLIINSQQFSNFGLSNNEPLDSLGISFDANFPIICESNLYQYITVTNEGNQLTDGQLTFTYDPILTALSIFPEPNIVNGNMLTFDIPELPINGIFTVNFIYDGQTADLTGEVVSTEAELSYYNSSNILTFGSSISSLDSIYCSYDPNDIYGFPLGSGDEGFIPANTPMDYRIRFQNTGNYPATNVVLVDTLPEELNWDSFVPKNASHTYTVQLNEDTREIRWTFADINLPDSSSDPLGSNGYVWFGIGMNDLDQGEQILNQAAIYFDFNPAIYTNISSHTIQGILKTSDIDKPIPFTLFPNPATDQLSLQFDNDWYGNVEIFDLQGRKCSEMRVHSQSVILSLSGLESGMYIITLTDNSDQKMASSRFVKL